MTLKIITFKLDEETLKKLNMISEEMGIVRSEIIRKAIMLYLKENEQKQKPRIKVVLE
jgi:metal-responsive CopG/Arc/MetJ family transcriptional regulator